MVKTPFETREIEQIYLRKLSELISIRRPIYVLDVGAGKDRGENQVEHYSIREISNKKIIRITIDITKISPNILTDASEMPFKDACFDLVFFESVLEHVRPAKLTRISEEAHRVLNRNGLLLGWVPFYFPYHGSTDMPDLIRFTKEGVNLLFSQFDEVFIEPSGGPISILIKSFALPDALRFLSFQRLESRIQSRIRKEYLPAIGFRFIAVKQT